MPTYHDLRQAGGGVALQVIDYTEQELVAAATAAGVALASYDQVDSLQWWRVERIVVSGSSTSTCEVTVYQGQAAIAQRARDWTPMPPGFVAIAEYPNFLTVLPGSCLTVEITGANSGDVFNITAQYQVVQKVAG